MLVRRGYDANEKLENLLSETVIVERQGRPQWSVLHGDVFLASYTFQRPVVEAWVIADARACAVLGGDLEAILGLRLDRQGQVAHAVREYNVYVRSTGGTAVLSGADSVTSYATAVLELLIPSHQHLVVNEVDDVPLQGGADELASQRARDCLQGVRPLAVEPGSTGHTVSFFSWEEIGGILASNTVLVFANGEVNITHEVVCEQVGRYRIRGRL
jgi:hypothetical protein